MAPIWHKIGPNDPVPEDAFVCFEAVSAAQPVIHLARMTYRGNTLVGHVIHGKAYFVYQGEMHTSREFEVLLLNGSNLIWKQADECGHSLKAGTAMGHFGSRVPVCIGKLANLRGAGQVVLGRCSVVKTTYGTVEITDNFEEFSVLCIDENRE